MAHLRSRRLQVLGFGNGTESHDVVFDLVMHLCTRRSVMISTLQHHNRLSNSSSSCVQSNTAKFLRSRALNLAVDVVAHRAASLQALEILVIIDPAEYDIEPLVDDVLARLRPEIASVLVDLLNFTLQVDLMRLLPMRLL